MPLRTYFYVIILEMLKTKMLSLLPGAEMSHADSSKGNVQSRDTFSQICFTLLFAGHFYPYHQSVGKR